MKALLAVIRAITLLIMTLIQMGALMVESAVKGRSEQLGFKHRRIWARKSMKILGVSVDEVTGSLDIPTALIISNHRGMIDPVIQLAYLDAFIIAKASVSKLPVISQGAQMTGIIFVDRTNLRSRLAARNTTEDLLLEGHPVIVYAEGTTGTDRTTDRFKPGTFAIAAKHQIPVVPVAIEYPARKDYWYDGSLVQQMIRQVGAWKTVVKLKVSDPIVSSDAKELLRQVQSKIDEDLIAMQKGWSEVFEEKL